MARFIHDGKSIDHTPTGNLSAGDVVVQNDLIGIAKLDIAAGTLGSLAVTGVFDVPKATGAGTALGVGIKLRWDAVHQRVTTAADDGGTPATPYPYLGKVVRTAADADETVRVRLEQ
jgi:predicted RecA/RadA family phage recombinase